MSGPPEPPPPLWLKIVGLLIACAGALLAALVGAFLTPFRLGTVLVPVSLILAVVGPIAFTRFAQAVTDHKGLSLIPGAIWITVTVLFSARTTEGDLVLTQASWVATLYPLFGAATLAVFGYGAARDYFRVGGLGR
jgi:hypothetical protein